MPRTDRLSLRSPQAFMECSSSLCIFASVHLAHPAFLLGRGLTVS